MLDTVAKGFRPPKNLLTAKAEITEELVDEPLRDIRVSLLSRTSPSTWSSLPSPSVKEKVRRRCCQDTAVDKGGKKSASRRSTSSSRSATTARGPMGPVDVSLKLPCRWRR